MNFENPVVENNDSDIEDIALDLEEKDLIQSKIERIINRYGKICLMSLGLLGINSERSKGQTLNNPSSTIEAVSTKNHEAYPKLRPHEYIIPDTIMRLRDLAIGQDKDTDDIYTAGMYITPKSETYELRRFLASIFDKGYMKQKQNFDQWVSELPLPPDSLSILKNHFFKSGNILIIEGQSRSANDFKQTLFHERIHKAIFEELNDHERLVLETTRIEIIKEWKKLHKLSEEALNKYNSRSGSDDGEKELSVLRELHKTLSEHVFYKAYGSNEFKMYYSIENEHEFYSSLTSAEHPEIFEKYLKDNYPETSEIFSRIMNKVTEER